MGKAFLRGTQLLRTRAGSYSADLSPQLSLSCSLLPELHKLRFNSAMCFHSKPGIWDETFADFFCVRFAYGRERWSPSSHQPPESRSHCSNQCDWPSSIVGRCGGKALRNKLFFRFFNSAFCTSANNCSKLPTFPALQMNLDIHCVEAQRCWEASQPQRTPSSSNRTE